MKILRVDAVALAFIGAVSSLGCLSGEMPRDGEETVATENAIRGGFDVGAKLIVTSDVYQRSRASPNGSILQLIPNGTTVVSAARMPKAGWYGITWNGLTGWVDGKYVGRPLSAPTEGEAGEISQEGQAAMNRIVTFADAHNSGRSGGRCYEYVWDYLWRSEYGKLRTYYDAPDMGSAEARMFAEYMGDGGHAGNWGLRRLPLSSPYEAPRGAVVVVAAGSPGTSHPTAGDISIAAGGGRFINDGPNMGYGGSHEAFLRGGGKVLGIFVPY